MTSLAAELSRITGQAFAAEGLSEDFGRVTASDRPDLAQFQCNGALAAAKHVLRSAEGGAGGATKSNPRAIAEKIASRLKAETIFSKVEIAGVDFQFPLVNGRVRPLILTPEVSEIVIPVKAGIFNLFA